MYDASANTNGHYIEEIKSKSWCVIAMWVYEIVQNRRRNPLFVSLLSALPKNNKNYTKNLARRK